MGTLALATLGVAREDAHGPQLGDAVHEPAGLLQPFLCDGRTPPDPGCAPPAHHQLSGAAHAICSVPRDRTSNNEQSVLVLSVVHLQQARGLSTCPTSRQVKLRTSDLQLGLRATKAEHTLATGRAESGRDSREAFPD